MKLSEEVINKGWYLIPSDNVMKCEECDYVGKEWAENDNFQEVKGTQYSKQELKNFLKQRKITDDEICNTVFCPNCSSWSYFDVEYDNKGETR
jgi:protein-arginine kinase activator protein McsA